MTVIQGLSTASPFVSPGPWGLDGGDDPRWILPIEPRRNIHG